MWHEWRRLTRLLGSARLAFNTEVEKCEAVYVGTSNSEHVLTLEEAGSIYETNLHDHITTLKDTDILYQMALIKSYDLMELHAKMVRYISENKKWHLLSGNLSTEEQKELETMRLEGGIEAWSQKLMRYLFQDWSRVYKGQTGLIEIAKVRNLLVHGYTHVPAMAVREAQAQEIPFPFAPEQRIAIDFPCLHEYRGRIRSFCRILGDGVVHLHRNSHEAAPTSK